MNEHLRVLAIGFASCLLLLSGTQCSSRRASSPEPNSEPDLFLDLDRDGTMSFEEFARSLDTRSMDALDANRDGFLSTAEAGARSADANDSVDLRFSDVDTNGDGRLSANELEAATRKHARVRVLYDTVDVDRDNRVTRSEWRNAPAGVGLLRIEF